MDPEALLRSAFVLVLLLSVIASYHMHKRRFRYATEGSVALLLGCTITGTMYVLFWLVAGEPLPRKLVRFNDQVFFDVLLPPIIFWAGFSVKKRRFFAHFVSIFCFGFFGTLANATAIAAGAAGALKVLGMCKRAVLPTALALGAICSSSDTVSILQLMDQRKFPTLYSLIFGEGIVNDGVSVVLLSTVQKMGKLHDPDRELTFPVMLELLGSFIGLFTGSLLLGVAVGLASALVMRRVFSRSHDCDREVMVLALMGFLSYLLALSFDLSAILAVFFCGITMSHYTWHALCPAAQSLSLHSFRIVSSAMEMVLYAYSGIDIWCTAMWQHGVYRSASAVRKAASLSSLLLLLIVVARAAFTFPIACLANVTWRRSQKLSFADMVVVYWGGLARGAITLALTYHHFSDSLTDSPDPDDEVIIVAMVGLVLITTLALGSVTAPFLEFVTARKPAGGDDSSRPRGLALVKALLLGRAPQTAPDGAANAAVQAAARGRRAAWLAGLPPALAAPLTDEVGDGGTGDAAGDALASPLLPSALTTPGARAPPGFGRTPFGFAANGRGAPNRTMDARTAALQGLLSPYPSINGTMLALPTVYDPSDALSEGGGAGAPRSRLSRSGIGASMDGGDENGRQLDGGREEPTGLHRWWRQVDHVIMQPIFGGRTSLHLPLEFSDFGVEQ